MTKEIIALNNLYTRTKKEFSEIETDNTDSELEQMDSTLQSIKEYFDRLLDVIPKDMSIYFDGRPQIRLEKTFFYDTKDKKQYDVYYSIGRQICFPRTFCFRQKI